MKKTIGILTACLLVAGGVQAAQVQHAPNAITSDMLAEVNAQFNAPEAKESGKAAKKPPVIDKTQVQNGNVKNAQNVKSAPQGEAKEKTAQQVKKEPRVVRKTVKLTPPQEKWYLTKPTDFTYYVNKEGAAYSLAIPYAFGSDLLAGLPVSGPMIARGASDTVAMSFNAASAGDAAQIFKAALAGKKQLPPPAPVTKHITLPADKAKGTPAEEVIEITEFEAPPQYSYEQVDVTPLGLPEQLKNLTLVEAGEYKTFQRLNSQYMQFKCTSGGVPCMVRLTLTQYSGYQYTGFYLFPEAQRLTFIPLANYSARSLQCGSRSVLTGFNKVLGNKKAP